MPPSQMVRAMSIAAGVAAGAGAAQLGIGYGLGAFSWLPSVRGVDEAAWLASLTWTVWISALSVVVGTLVADRAALPTVGMSPAARTLWRGILALAAALGGLIVAVLTAVPSRAAQRADTFAPHLIVGGYAIAGVLLGLFVAVAVVGARAVATNVILTAGWLWLLAAVSAGDALAARNGLRVAQLGVWRITSDGPWFHGIYLPGAAIAVGGAFLIGAFTAWPASVRGDNRVIVALSGAAGPVLVAVAYLLAVPAKAAVSQEQLVVLAGLAGSVLVILLARGRAARPKAGPKPPAPAAATGRATVPAAPAAPAASTATPPTAAPPSS